MINISVVYIKCLTIEEKRHAVRSSSIVHRKNSRPAKAENCGSTPHRDVKFAGSLWKNTFSTGKRSESTVCRVAQLAEHQTLNLGVGGSTPPCTTIPLVYEKQYHHRYRSGEIRPAGAHSSAVRATDLQIREYEGSTPSVRFC